MRPPSHLAIVIGGTSAEFAMKTRQALGKIAAVGEFIEAHEPGTARFLPDTTDDHLAAGAEQGVVSGSLSGSAARLAQDRIEHVEVLESAELGMEAVWKIEVEGFPAFIVVDDKGNDFLTTVTRPMAMTIPKRPAL